MKLYEVEDKDNNISFGVNKTFAAAYETKKRTEELSKLQDKYGANYTLSDEESEEEDLSSDDSDAEFVTPQVDVAILRTLARIRQKDPLVYEDGRQVFDEEENRTAESTLAQSKAKTTSSKSKPVLLKDYQRTRMLLDPTDSLPDTVSSEGFHRTFAQEESDLKNEVTKAFHLGGADEGESEEEDDLLVPREKTKDEREREDEEYQRFLKDNVGDREVEDALEQEEKFLRDYILNRGWIDRSGNKSRIPSYNEITGSPPPVASASGSNAALPKVKKVKKAKKEVEEGVDAEMGEVAEGEDKASADVGANDSEDSEYEERAEEFEHKYNFRFEEAAGLNILTHSRNLGSTVRKPTAAVTARARARDAAKEKKDEEKAERREEVRRLKALKRKEVEVKLLKLLEVAGDGAKGLKAIDLDGDWDPEEHDKRMADVYDEEYGDIEDADFKPVWDDDVDITDLQTADEIAEDEADRQANDDGAYDPSISITKVKKEKNLKRKRDNEGFPTELLEAARTGGDAERKAYLDSMVDEYYNLDYEDKIGDVTTRFRYAKVAPQTYSLTPAEILMATDTELNSYVSLRKMAPYRHDDDKKGKSKKRLKEFRDSQKDRKWGVEIDEEGEGEGAGYIKKKKWSEENGRGDKDEKTGTGAVKRVGKKERERKKLKLAAEGASIGEASGEVAE